VLRRENELLKQTITDAQVSIQELEVSLKDANVPVPDGQPLGGSAAIDPANLQPEDFWSPAIEVPPGYEYRDEYGAITPVPHHDGTECLKWDDTLWSHADHFKVRPSRQVRESLRSISTRRM
jgi:1,4-alpha-glucan branching enzyme